MPAMQNRRSARRLIWGLGAVLAVATMALAILFVRGDVEGMPLLLWILGILFLGDVLAAIGIEMTAPSRITIGPGERASNDAPMRECAAVLSEVAGDREGRVRIRGETWKARLADPAARPIAAGRQARVVARDGLALLIAEPDGTC